MCMFGLQKSEGGKCPSLGHGKTMINENVSGASGSTHAVLPGRTPESSCAQLAKRVPDIPSGSYLIPNSIQSLAQVF